MSAEQSERRLLPPEVIESIQSKLPTPEEATALADLMQVLADPTRVGIVGLLTAGHELSIHALVSKLDGSLSAVSQAIQLLRAAGLVTHRGIGRTQLYSLHPDQADFLNEILGIAEAHVQTHAGHNH